MLTIFNFSHMAGENQEYSQCSIIFFSLFTFEFNHVLPFPGSACYHAEVLGLLVRVFFFFFFFHVLAFFNFRLTNRQTDNQRTHSTVNKKKVNGLRGSTPKQHTMNLAPRAFFMVWEGKRPWDQG